MAIVPISMDPEARGFRWICPTCGHDNLHNGHMNKVPEDVQRIVREEADNIAEEIAEETGGDDVEVRVFAVPAEVWCAKCEDKHQPQPVAEAGGFDLEEERGWE